MSISGAAGTGKTATLKECDVRSLKPDERSWPWRPTMSAVEELQRVGFANTVTLERLLQDRKMREGLDQAVVILDEAGMVSARQMANFLRLAEA